MDNKTIAANVADLLFAKEIIKNKLETLNVRFLSIYVDDDIEISRY